MTALTWQTLLLLSLAYLLGCWLACLVRRMIGPSHEPIYPDVVPAGQATPAVAVARAAPSTVPMPAPAQPAPLAPVRDAFRRADTLEPDPTAAARPRPMPERQVEVAAPGRPVAPQPSTPAPAPVAPSAPMLPSAINTAAVATAATAAAAVAAAAVARSVQVAPPPAPVQPRPATAPTPVAPAVVAPSEALDDLKRIRTIDPGIEAALRRLGVRRFADIAAWMPADVQRFSQELGFKGRIEQENWIEQAQILAKGGDTLYSSRLARGEVANGQPVESKPAAPPTPVRVAPPPAATAQPVPAPAVTAPAAPVIRPAVVAVPQVAPAAPATPRPERSSVEAAAATAAAMAAAAATARSAAAPARPAPAPSTEKVEAGLPSAPEVADRAAFGAARPAPVPAADAAPAPAVRPAVGSGRDSLQRIGGVTPEIEKLLNVQGISRYGQIAQWNTPDVERFDRLLGYRGRIQRENWIEQAQILARGGDTAYSREHDRRTAVATGAAPAPVTRVQAPSIAVPEGAPVTATPAPASPAAAAATAAAAAAAAAVAAAASTVADAQPPAGARPTNLAEAIRSTEARAPEQPAAARSSDLSSLRSVRSEAYRPDSPAASGTGARPAEQHDLKRIRGIGVLIEKKLNSMGVTRYEQIADWSAPDIERVSVALDFKGRIERENWVEQARILASGGQTEFSRRVDKGDGSSS